MHILLLIFYGALASYGIWKIPFLRNSGIRPGWLWILFFVHVLTGWLHNWIAWRYFPDHGDIWNYFSLSFLYRHRLLSEFHLFLLDNSTWTYITHNGIVYVHLLLNLLSSDDMTIDTLLFAFPVFMGNVALYRVFRRRFNGAGIAGDGMAGDGMAAGSVLWLPSVVFWTSCIYREGMLYMLLGFLFYHLDHYFSTRSRRSFYFALGLFLLIAYFRLAVATVLIPAVLAWWWFDARPRVSWKFAAAAIILSTTALSIPGIRSVILGAVTTEQASFQILEGHSRLSLPALNGGLASFWRALPYAIRNGLFEPLPGSGGRSLYIIFSIELVLVWVIVVLAIISTVRSASTPPSDPTLSANVPHTPYSLTRPAASRPNTFSLACALFALTGMLLIGFVVPFAGTIVRYRSIYLPFLLGPALHALSRQPALQRLNSWLNNKLHFLI